MPWYRMPDGTPFHARIGKRKGSTPAPCRVRRPDKTLCGCMSGYLCDWPINEEGDTCDMPLCETHAAVVGEDRHLCPKHAEIAKA